MEIQEFIKCYHKLSLFEYEIELKDCAEKFNIIFGNKNAYHILGLHKIKGINGLDKFYELDYKNEIAVNKFISDKIVLKMIDNIKRENNYADIKERIYFFNMILWTLYSGDYYFIESGKVSNKSRLQSNLLIRGCFSKRKNIETKLNDGNIYQYISFVYSDIDNNVLVPNSTFLTEFTNPLYIDSGATIKKVDKILIKRI